MFLLPFNSLYHNYTSLNITTTNDDALMNMNDTFNLNNDTLLNFNDTLIPLADEIYPTPEDESTSIWIFVLAAGFILICAFILIFCRICKRNAKKNRLNFSNFDYENGQQKKKGFPFGRRRPRGRINGVGNISTLSQEDESVRSGPSPMQQIFANIGTQEVHDSMVLMNGRTYVPPRDTEIELNEREGRAPRDPEIASLVLRGDNIYYRGQTDSTDSDIYYPRRLDCSFSTADYETQYRMRPRLNDEPQFAQTAPRRGIRQPFADVSIMNAFPRTRLDEPSLSE